MTSRRKRFIVVAGVLGAVAVTYAYVTSTRDRPQATVTVKPGESGSLVAVLSVTNATARNFTVFSLLQTQEGATWCEADEQPEEAGSRLILSKGRTVQFKVELPAVTRTYRFRFGYEPYDPPAISVRVFNKLSGLRLPGVFGEPYRRALTRLRPQPKLLVTERFKTWQVAQAALAGAASQPSSDLAGYVPFYSDEFRSYYPTRGRRFELDGYELETPVVVWDAGHHRKISFVRTYGGKYGYDQQRGLITITGARLDQPRFLSLLGFRHLRIEWITDKLILLLIDIGHVAGVKAIYDVEEDKFVYRQSVGYGVAGEPTPPVPASQPPRTPNPVSAETIPMGVDDPPEPRTLLPISPAPPVFLAKEAKGGMTYEIGVYVVKSGDNLTAIAHRLHLTIKDLKELNPELANDSIQVGQQLRVYEKPSW